MASWQWITIDGEKFIFWDLDGVGLIHSTGRVDYREKSRVEALSRKLGLIDVVSLRQVHGARVLRAEGCRGILGEEGDALIATTPRLGIGVLTADCLPLLFFTPGMIALLHVGWRGLKGGILGEALDSITSLNIAPSEIDTVFGPSIGKCCYQVGEDMLGELRKALPANLVMQEVEDREGKSFLSLSGLVVRLLKEHGVGGSIYRFPICTCCSKWFPSYRREGSAASRFLSLAWRK